MKLVFLLLLLLLLLPFIFPTSEGCDRCVHNSIAAISYLHLPPSPVSPSAPSLIPNLAAGACGYRSDPGYASVAAASSSIFRDGFGCGGCFQIRCRDAKLCNGAGVKVVVTDFNKKIDGPDFVLGLGTFSAMSRPGMAARLQRLGAIQVQHKRIPCEYLNKNLTIRVEESSRRPNNLTIRILYQGGQTDIVEVDVAGVGSSAWQFMSRFHGPVWTTSPAPKGPLQFRFVVTGGYDGKWVWAQREVLPADWRPGDAYDAGVQITDIAQEGCYPCDEQEWRR